MRTHPAFALCWQNNNRLVAGLTLLKTSIMMTVADPQEAFGGSVRAAANQDQPATSQQGRATSK